MIGKRKRDTTVWRRPEDQADEPPSLRPSTDESNDVFRKYFEARFDPLPKSQLITPSLQEDNADVDDDDNDSGTSQENLIGQYGEDDARSEWSGISDRANGALVVEVVNHGDVVQGNSDDPIDKMFQKSFMTSKPPRDPQRIPQPTKPSTPNGEDEDEIEEKMNLKQDLNLQRLLQESHLLGQNKQKPNRGAQRHRATDLRLQSLGSRASLFAQENMPMLHRKGIQARASSKAAHRQKEARENGIIIEKSSRKTSASSSRRDRGVDVPVVGKFKGGTLSLSRKDVASIQGPRAGTKKTRRR